MRVLMLEAPESLLEDRRRKGLDRLDEMWEGVLHMPPAPSTSHQDFGSELLERLRPLARARGFIMSYETALYLGDDSWRTPDLVVASPEDRTKRGVEGRAELVVELLSPDDESFEKLPFYETFGVREALYVDPETRFFTFYVRKRGKLRAVKPDKRGRLHCKTLDVTLETVKGPRLRVTWADGSIEI